MNYSTPYNPIYTSPIIISAAHGDVTGDGISDYVYLTGITTSDSPYVQKITLVIQDGRTGMKKSVPLKSDSGYNPTLFLGDFTGNHVKDIFISIASGGSGGIMFYYIYSDFCNITRLLFDYEVFNNAYKYDICYKDYYKVEVRNITKGIKFIIDISTRDADYLHEIYHKDGKLKSPIDGFVNPLSGLYPVDFDTNGVYELLAYQRISGRYAADALGYLNTTLKWDTQNFVMDHQNVLIFGVEC
ncbi:VCBS repeat-containing protein [Serpentinicella sp. ANB-PHB4]|uniref:VCBS repeat-containing protein n=1 Tax=Serpentinicella sp. ANB-PHB4 TaxID=3074076 RepID=UPI002861A2AC|nr:VCBS repeat-containing protein [Serpentinicella sp. ANB-PHB4]MDR5658434.1 VCBS repeat-containing protein [Serpentinicella sp. ANB-PHB4]